MATRIENIVRAKSLYGKKIYLLGTAKLGPVNTPIKVNTISQAVSIFGCEGSLIDAYRTIKETNLECEVYLCKVTGTHSDAYLNINQQNNEIAIDGFYIKSKHSSDKCNDITLVIDSTSLYIYSFSQETGESLLEYRYSNYNTMHDLAEAINNDTRELKGNVYCYVECDIQTPCEGALQGVNQDVIKLSGGNCGLYYNKNMYYNCLEETYAMLEGRDIDLIVPLDANYDDTFTDNIDDLYNHHNLDKEFLTLKIDDEYLTYYEQLLKFCKSQMRFGFLTHGIIGVSINEDPFLDEKKYVEDLKYFKKLNKPKDEYLKYQHLISVVVGDLYCTHGTRVINGYVPYAAMVSTLSVIDTTTNKSLPESFTTLNNFDNDTLCSLRELGFTSFRYSQLKKLVTVSNGVTMSEDENFKYLCNVRMSQLAMSYVRELLSSYIGENITEIIQTKSLEQSLIELLNSLVSLKVIKGFSVNEVINPVTGHIFLDLSFKTLYMIEDVKAYAGLASNGG